MSKCVSWWWILILMCMAAAVACGGGGGGGGSAGPPPLVSNDRDGDGIPDDQDAFPDDPALFSAYGMPAMLSNPAGGNFAVAVAINDDSVAIGMADTPANVYKAVRWEVGKGIAELNSDVLNGLDDNYSAAYGINDAGLTAGESSSGTAIVPVVWTPGASIPAALPLLPSGGANGAAYSVNTAGQVVGEAQNGSGNQVAVFWPGVAALPIVLDGLGGAVSAAYYLNDASEAVGEAEDTAGIRQAVIWDVGTGSVTALPMLHSDDAGAVALSINTAGQIVGELELADGSRTAVLWQPDVTGRYTAVDLGGSSAAAINDFNRIVGNAADTAVAWDDRSTVVGTANTVASGLFSHAYGINASHFVVGVQDGRAFVSAEP